MTVRDHVSLWQPASRQRWTYNDAEEPQIKGDSLITSPARAGRPCHVTTLLPDHPIATGLPRHWDIPQTEMYDEPFHVPPPDQVIFEEKWDLGEHFRSGCVWNIGKGKVFYFRPGHEIDPVYKQELPLRVIENACRWLGAHPE